MERSAGWAAYWACSGNAREGIQESFLQFAADAHAAEAVDALDARDPNYATVWDDAQIAARAEHVWLLRHLIGNPFHPAAAPSSWPPLVSQLTAALYAGEDCAFALHDALLEAGHADLAEHFREAGHPKGCWALDLILGKC
jgi:hypothetical protein